MLEHLFDAVHEVLALDDEQGDELCGVYLAAAELAEVSALFEELLSQFLLVAYLRYGDDGEAAQVAVHEHGLRVGVADDADARLACELVQFRLEACAEVGAFQVVDTAEEFACVAQGGHAAAFRTEV